MIHYYMLNSTNNANASLMRNMAEARHFVGNMPNLGTTINTWQGLLHGTTCNFVMDYI